MILRDLGKTGVRVSEIGLGTEHLKRANAATVAAVVNKAVENGINYFDLIFNFQDYLKNLGVAFQDQRERVILTSHLGSSDRGGQYFKTRSVKLITRTFQTALARLGTDYVDVANITYVKNIHEYEEVTKPGSVLELAQAIRKDGKARLIGISTHDVKVVKKAAKSGLFDVITFQVNMANNALPGRNNALATCVREGVGVVAMKPFAGGRLLVRNKTVRITPLKKGGGTTLKVKIPPEMTPHRCLAYTLSQLGVSTTIPGVRRVEELDEILTYHDTSTEERDFSKIVKSLKEYGKGQCVYCNHCLPCPANIDIAEVTRSLDAASLGLATNTQTQNNALQPDATDCTKCSACMTRCPFDVDIIANMEAAAKLATDATPAKSQKPNLFLQK